MPNKGEPTPSEKVEKFLMWLKQPSTLKGITLGVSIIFASVTQAQIEAVVTLAASIYAAIALFYDKG